MDFLDPSNKRSYNTRLFIGFFLSALVIVLGTLILSLITSGYTISSKTGQVIQNGLIFLDSSPTSATVYVNHQSSGATNTRLELGAANYNISLYAPGYNTWTTNLSLLGGNVEDLTYPLLIPIKPVISSIAEYPTKPEVFSQTPNKHWLLVSDPTLANSFKVYDQTNTKTAITTSTIPSNLLVSTAGPNVFTAIQWASDNQHILLQDEYNGAINFIVFNYLTPTDSYNLNQTFPISFTSAKLLNFQYTTPLLFDEASGNLYQGDQSTKQTTLILTKVIDYADYGTNKFLYVTSDGTNDNLSSIMFSNLHNKPYLVKNVAKTSKYMLNVSSYGSNYYYLIGGGGIYDYIYQNLANNAPSNNRLPMPYTLMVNNVQPQNVLSSASQRYISLQSGNNFSVYDIQTQEHYRYALSVNLNDPNFTSWMDDNRFISFSSGKMIVFDFNGTNIVSIATANNSFDGLFTPGYTAVYYLNYDLTNNNWIVDRAGMVAGQP